MAIKEKDSETLEKMILSLLNKSPAIQNKLRSICGLSQNIPSGSYGYSAEVPQTEQLTAQIKQYKSDYQQTAAKLQEYKNYSTQLQSKCNALETDRSNLQNRVSQLENELISVKSGGIFYMQNKIKIIKQGIKTVIIPSENKSDLDEVDDVVKKEIEFVFADNIKTVLDTALIKS